MAEVRKRFSRDLYNKYDEIGKEATIKHLEAQGYTVRPHESRYMQDLRFDDGCVECEVRPQWKGEEFPWPVVNLPKRKEKFFNEDTLFYIWNADQTRAATFWSYEIKDLEPEEVPNKYCWKDEYFYRIPQSMVRFVS